MKIAVIERQPVRVFYLRYTGPGGAPVSRFWRTTVSPWLADHGLLDCPRYGVLRDDPCTTPPEECRYDACVEVPAGLRPADAREMTLAGGRHAVTVFRGTSGEAGAFWEAFTAACCAAHVIDRERPPFEHYPRGAAFDSKTGIFACELCIAISS
jgi:AraC family transcriptional regulator